MVERTVLEKAPNLGGQVLRALGIDPATVTNFTLTCVGAELLVLKVVRILRAGDGAAVSAQLERFDVVLQPKCEPTPAALPGAVFAVGSLSGIPSAITEAQGGR
ncbi:hypothetical protein [Acidovorax sp. Leaf160]|uniref:hypothetical protein n=1 Tax=Acidovorax sp. Leaf160 TaxID=1736280 RepID=UPI0006F54F01|nr:hypothetical protein [Acidovorax sp. Leaf160]KQR55647.1 hypothetical protein ASF94_04400 [Acidovorax sp. Leaf160]